MLPSLVIFILTTITGLGILWLVFDDACFKQRASGRPWSAQPIVRIPAVCFGPLACLLLAAFALKLGGTSGLWYSLAYRAWGVCSCALWLVIIGSASANQAVPGFVAGANFDRLIRLDALSDRYLGDWRAVRILAGAVLGGLLPKIAPQLVVALVIMAANPPLTWSSNPFPALRATLGLKPRPAKVVQTS